MGYKLNDKGLYDKKTGTRINFEPKTEKDIFDFLKIEYVKPENRK
jgi:DNA polymerase/3'-5' exonuclease PolX